MKQRFLMTLFLCLFDISNVAADVSVELALDRSSAVLTDTVILKVIVNDERKSSHPEIEGLDVFDVVSGGTSTSMQIINGDISSRITYTLYLTPRKYGKFTIGPARVKTDGKVYFSNKVSLHVVKNKENLQSTKPKGALFIKAVISKKNLYINQQALYTLRFFRRKNVSDISLKMPNADSIVFNKLTEPKKYSTILDSVKYDVIELRYIVIPKKTGKQIIPPAGMRMTVYQKKRLHSLFDDPFFNLQTGKSINLYSNEVEINVKKLPDKGKPDNFCGLVGEFNINAMLKPEKIKAGDSATLTVKIKGTGNIKQIPDIKIEKIKGLKFYEDKPVLEIIKDDAAITGEKTMKWAIVPEKGGNYKIPVQMLIYFDPVREKYIKLETEPKILKAESGKKDNLNYAARSESNKDQDYNKRKKEEIARLGRDIFPVHTSNNPIEDMNSFIFYKTIYIFAIFVPPVILILFIGIRLVKNNRKNGFAARSKNARKVFLKKIQHKNVKPEDLNDAIYEYLNNRLLLKGGVITPGEAEQIITQRGVSFDVSNKLHDYLKLLESVIFAGKRIENVQKIQIELKEIVKSIEKEVK